MNVDEQTQDVTLELGCAEVSERPMPIEGAMPEETWGALDCAGDISGRIRCQTLRLEVSDARL